MLIGKRFGMLRVVKYLGKDRWKKHLWLCNCDCGGSSKVVQGQLVGARSVRSCGCLKRAGNRRTHGSSRKNGKQLRTYTAWTNMKGRCDNPNKPQYKDWGGRGVSYDPRWKKFENFLSDMGECPYGLSLDRVDNDKGYTKENCRWTDRATQRRNARNVRLVEYEGQVYILKDLLEKLSVSYGMVVSRIHSGWSIQEAIFTPRLRR